MGSRAMVAKKQQLLKNRNTVATKKGSLSRSNRPADLCLTLSWPSGCGIFCAFAWPLGIFPNTMPLFSNFSLTGTSVAVNLFNGSTVRRKGQKGSLESCGFLGGRRFARGGTS